MFFILAIILMLFLILTLILYKALAESVIPLFLQSEYLARFNKRLSRAILLFIIDIKNDIVSHLETICEPDGDEPFEPFMDSPLRTCPPTEYVLSPPKEVISETISGNNGQVDRNNNPRRRPRRRVGEVVAPAPVEPVIPVPAIPGRVVQNNNMLERVGPRRVMQLQLEGLLSPPPQLNNRNNAFQFFD